MVELNKTKNTFSGSFCNAVSTCNDENCFHLCRDYSNGNQDYKISALDINIWKLWWLKRDIDKIVNFKVNSLPFFF